MDKNSPKISIIDTSKINDNFINQHINTIPSIYRDKFFGSNDEIKKVELFCTGYLTKLNLTSDQIDSLQINNLGKIIDNSSEIYCSISHSKNVMILAAHTCPIGVDIEIISDIDYKEIVQKHFNKQEKTIIDFQQKDDAKLKHFLIIWCCKEALYKCILNQDDIKYSDLHIQKMEQKYFAKIDKTNYFFKIIETEKFIAAICSQIQFDKIQINKIN